MTTPGGNFPEGTYGSDLSGLSGLSESQWRANLSGSVIGAGGGAVGFNGLFGSLGSLIFSSVDNTYIAQLPIVNDHTQSITEVQAAVDRMILQGQAKVYNSNNTHYVSDGVTSVDVIILGAGGGGGGGKWNLLAASIYPGCGGGGGGEVHLNIPAPLLGPTLQVRVGAGGSGGAYGGNPGAGGGDSYVATANGTVIAGGGQGGIAGSSAVRTFSAKGGSGMIQGGTGGHAASSDPRFSAGDGGDSYSQYDLHGGGGGGGGGSVAGISSAYAGAGGQGGIARGGVPGDPGGDPAGITATGGGGAGGATDTDSSAPDGGVPSGGGGGGYADAGNARYGGNGGQGRVFIIERTA